MNCIEKYIPHFMECMYSKDCKDLVRRDELIDMFNPNQMNSKNEALKAIEKLPKDEVKHVAYIGSWFGYLTRILCKELDYVITEIDIDERCKSVSEVVNLDYKFEKRTLFHRSWDANKISNNYYQQFDMIINLSTEHMTDEWFNNLSVGTFVLLQSNNFDSHPDHTNCVYSIEELKERFPLHIKLYESTLPCTIYDRYTLMGIT